jgi:hypothetical protein
MQMQRNGMTTVIPGQPAGLNPESRDFPDAQLRISGSR